VTQYQINGTFIDEDRISLEELAKLSLDTPNRQLVRIKRVRALKYENGKSSWNTNREYRVILQNNMLVGSVGVPNETYGEGDTTSENGNISLMRVK
jgi:Cu/Ag efflux pump CusA